MGWAAAIPSLLGAVSGIYSAYEGSKIAGKPINLNKIYNYDKGTGFLAPWKQGVDKQFNLSGQMFDPNSQFNQDTLTNFKQTGIDFSTAQNRMNQRNMASGGLGGFSGIQNAINQSNFMKSQNQAMDAWQQSLFNNQKLGTTLLGQATKGYKDFGSTMADGYLQNDALARTAALGKSSGINEGIMGLLANPEFASLFGVKK